MSKRTFPRKVVISPGWGAGIASWIHGSVDGLGYEVAEHPEVVAWVENGRGETDADTTTAAELVKRLWPEEEHICILGFDQAVVVTVNGPYMIEEYDGFESITEKNDKDIWRS